MMMMMIPSSHPLTWNQTMIRGHEEADQVIREVITPDQPSFLFLFSTFNFSGRGLWAFNVSGRGLRTVNFRMEHVGSFHETHVCVLEPGLRFYAGLINEGQFLLSSSLLSSTLIRLDSDGPVKDLILKHHEQKQNRRKDRKKRQKV